MTKISDIATNDWRQNWDLQHSPFRAVVYCGRFVVSEVTAALRKLSFVEVDDSTADNVLGISLAHCEDGRWLEYFVSGGIVLVEQTSERLEIGYRYNGYSMLWRAEGDESMSGWVLNVAALINRERLFQTLEAVVREVRDPKLVELESQGRTYKHGNEWFIRLEPEDENSARRPSLKQELSTWRSDYRLPARLADRDPNYTPSVQRWLEKHGSKVRTVQFQGTPDSRDAFFRSLRLNEMFEGMRVANNGRTLRLDVAMQSFWSRTEVVENVVEVEYSDGMKGPIVRFQRDPFLETIEGPTADGKDEFQLYNAAANILVGNLVLYSVIEAMQRETCLVTIFVPNEASEEPRIIDRIVGLSTEDYPLYQLRESHWKLGRPRSLFRDVVGGEPALDWRGFLPSRFAPNRWIWTAESIGVPTVPILHPHELIELRECTGEAKTPEGVVDTVFALGENVFRNLEAFIDEVVAQPAIVRAAVTLLEEERASIRLTLGLETSDSSYAEFDDCVSGFIRWSEEDKQTVFELAALPVQATSENRRYPLKRSLELNGRFNESVTMTGEQVADFAQRLPAIFEGAMASMSKKFN